MVACPHSVDNVKPLSEIRGTHIDQAFLGTCTNGRLDDLAAAAAVLEGKKIAAGRRMIIIPASEAIYLAALQAGYLETFLKAGGESFRTIPCLNDSPAAFQCLETLMADADQWPGGGKP